MSDPRYLVRAIEFKCLDEFGIDWTGSDESYWVFTALRPNSRPNTTRFKVFGDIDSGRGCQFCKNV